MIRTRQMSKEKKKNGITFIAYVEAYRNEGKVCRDKELYAGNIFRNVW